MRHLNSAAACIVSIVCLLPEVAGAQAAPTSSTDTVSTVGNGPLAKMSVGSGNAETARLPRHSADSVGDGIGYGALAGAGAGLAFMAIMYAGCDNGCDAPAPGPMYLSAAAVGAGIGAVTGWIIDRARQNTDRRVQVAGAWSPQRKTVRVALRF